MRLSTLVGRAACSLAAAAVGAGVFLGCGSSGQATSRGHGGSGGDDTAGSAGASGSDGAGGVGGASGSGPGGSSSGAGGSFQAQEAGAGDASAGCASSTYEGEQIPLDIFVMFDKSGSMNDDVTGGTKWDVIKGALTKFVQDPSTAGIGIGIQYFPAGISNTNCTMTGPNCKCINIFIGMLCSSTANGSCNVSDYQTPDVPIDLLPQVAPAIVTSLGNHSPGGQTPTLPALQGALAYATQWAQAHLDRKTIVVLATDGDPTGCGNDNNPDSIAMNVAAPAAMGTPPVNTFVIGVGSSLTSLNAIAMGGGTGQALIVDTGSGDPGQQFLDAMNQIRGKALSCDFSLPSPGDGGVLDSTKVNVNFTPTGGTEGLVGNVDNANACDPMLGGWYYDDPTHPTKLTVCPATCDQLTSVTSGKVNIVLGCKTMQIVPK